MKFFTGNKKGFLMAAMTAAIISLGIFAGLAMPPPFSEGDHVDMPDPGEYCKSYAYYVRYISVEPWEIVAYAYDPVTGKEIQKMKEIPPHPDPTGYTTGVITWAHKKRIYIREVEFNTLEPHQPFGVFFNCTSG